MMQIAFFALIALLTAIASVFLFRKLSKKSGLPLMIAFGLLALLLYLMLGAPKMI